MCMSCFFLSLMDNGYLVALRRWGPECNFQECRGSGRLERLRGAKARILTRQQALLRSGGEGTEGPTAVVALWRGPPELDVHGE